MARLVFRALLAIVVVALLFRVTDYGVELYRRVTLPSDLKPVLASVTPDEVIGRCGRPDTHVLRDLVFQDFYYRRASVRARFLRTGFAEQGWIFSSANEVLADSKQSRNDTRWALQAMPCLDGRSAP